VAVTRLLYFAWVREKVGIGEENLDLPPTLSTPLALAQWMASRGGGYRDAFSDPAKLRCAVDQVMTAMESPLPKANEIAFFPPVTGG
jgi:sulfur-carrier protein